MQITGLVGSRGILPVGDLLAGAQNTYSADAFHHFPTLSWLNSSDAFLQLLCVAGIVTALLILFGVLTVPALIAAWIFYLSLTVDGQIFLGYQWDTLLLEAGFLAILVAPFQLLPRLSRERQPPRLMLWLLRLLLFRLMFSSGIVKLASRDPNWASLTALTYHYYTQPIPTPLAWYAQQMPLWFQQVSALMVFVIELIVPFLIFAPWRRARITSAFCLISLQLLILLTGNYTFFNLLTIALCLLLFDDAFIRRWLPPFITKRLPTANDQPLPRFRRLMVIPIAVLIVVLAGLNLVGLFIPLSDSIYAGMGWFVPFRIVNRYGLFAVMTTQRLEIEVEGSNDGQHWQTYSFRYKAEDVNRPPPWVAPLQPRLDWQMWFAALGSYQANPWFSSFMTRLLEGSPDVLALLETNPFPDAPPRYIRATAYDYHFTTWVDRNASGAWWQRDLSGAYFPVSTLGNKHPTMLTSANRGRCLIQ